MAPDSRSTPDDASARAWTHVERGAFIFGRCDRCGFQSPARRARHSVESDMSAHVILCQAEQAVEVTTDRTLPGRPR